MAIDFMITSSIDIKAHWYFLAMSVAVAVLPDKGAPCTIIAIPRLFRAALPSAERSIPRCRAMAAETGVISNSPTPNSGPKII